MNHDIPPPPPPPPAPIAPPPPPPPPAPGIIGKSKKNDESTTKFRRFAWKKIPDVQITDAETIWSPKENSKNTPRLSVDINTIQELFAVKDVKSKIRSPSPRGSRAGLGPQNENKGPITFLDTKQSMNINIFLRQFKRSIKDVVTAIQECDTSLLSAEKLRTLCKLIPEKDELKKLEEFKGDEDCLDKADKFVLGILKIPSYKLRIECAILRDEYTPAIREIEESLDILQKAMFEIRNCLAFPALLHLVLQAGNVLNQGVSYGNASGFRLHSLKKLSETKANQPGITMMHYVAMELEKQDHLMMRWPEQLPSLSKAFRISATETRNDLAILRKKVQTIKDCVERDKNDDLKEKVRGFMKDAESDFKALSIKEDKFAKDCNDLALYLCEQPSQFSLEECFSIVEEFRNKFIQAAKENSRKEKLKAKRERNRNISSHSFSDISAASRLSVDEAKRSLDDVEYGGRFRRRNTVDIARRRQRSPMPNRPVSDPAKPGSAQEVEFTKSSEASLQNTLDSRLDFKVERVTMTKLEPIQRQSSESVADVLLSRERDTSWGTAYVPESIGTTRQIDPSITKRNSNAEDVSEAVESSNVENGRPTRRRYRSLRSGLWDSEDGGADLRDKREYFGSTNSLNTLAETAENQITLSPNADKNNEKDFLSPREKIRLRHSSRRVRTDLKLAEDTYVTRTGEILPINQGKSASDRPRSHEEFSSRYSTQEDEDAGKKKSRHDDIRERIRRYKEKNEKENKTMFRQASEETSDYSLRRSRPASDGSSINRLSRIFEKRSVSYAGEGFDQRSDEIVSANSDLKLEDVSQVLETSTLVTPLKINASVEMEHSPAPQKPIFKFEIDPQVSNDATIPEDLHASERIRRYKEKKEKENETMYRQVSEETSEYPLRRSNDGSTFNKPKTDLESSRNIKTDSESRKTVSKKTDAKTNVSITLIDENNDESETTSVFSAEDQIDRKEEIGSDDVNPRDSLPCEISDDEKIPNDTTMHISEHDRRDTSSFDRHRIIVHMDRVEEAEISKSKAQQKSSYTESIADKLAVIDVAEKKISNDALQLKSGMIEVMEQSDLSNKHHYIEDTSGIIEENITVVDAFSVLAEKELEDAEPETAQKASPRLHMNTDDDNNNTVTSLKSLGNELKNRKDKLKSKRVSATPLTPAARAALRKPNSPAAQVKTSQSTTSSRPKTFSNFKTTSLKEKIGLQPVSAEVLRKTRSRGKSVSPKSSTTVPPAKSVSKSANSIANKKDHQISKVGEAAKSEVSVKRGNGGVTSSVVRPLQSSNSTSKTTTSPSITKTIEKKPTSSKPSSARTVTPRSGEATGHDVNSRRAPKPGPKSFMGLRGRNSPMRNSTNSINRIGIRTSSVVDSSTLPRAKSGATTKGNTGSRLRRSTESIDEVGIKATVTVESNILPRTKTGAKTKTAPCSTSISQTRNSTMRGSSDIINRLGVKSASPVESNTLPRSKFASKARVVTSATTLQKRNSPMRGSTQSIDKIETSVGDSSTLPRASKTPTAARNIAATVARLARPRSIASASDLRSASVSKSSRSNGIENHNAKYNSQQQKNTQLSKPSSVKIEYLSNTKQPSKSVTAAEEKTTKPNSSATSKEVKPKQKPSGQHEVVNKINAHSSKSTTKKPSTHSPKPTSKQPIRQKLTSATKQIKSSPNESKPMKSDGKEISGSKNIIDSLMRRKTTPKTTNQKLTNGEITPANKSDETKSTVAVTKKSSVSRVADIKSRDKKTTRDTKSTNMVEIEQKSSKNVSSPGNNKTRDMTSRSSPSTKVVATSTKNPSYKPIRASLKDSGLRSVSSSNLSLRESPPKKKFPPSSYRPLKDSISARSTSSISSTVSNSSADVTLNRTARLRLSRLNMNKK